MSATGPASFAECVAATHFSFLTGASSPGDMVAEALALGMAGIGIADRNSVAGVVRAHVALREARAAAIEAGADLPPFRLIVGARLVFADGTPDIIAYPRDRPAWGRLTRLLTVGNLRAEKGDCILHLDDLLPVCGGMVLIVMPGPGMRQPGLLALLARLRAATPTLWLAGTMPRGGRDRRRLVRIAGLARVARVPLIATNDALYATPAQRALHDILTCVREKVTIVSAGRRLAVNAERYLKAPREMARLFADQPQALAASADVLVAIGFTLDDLAYQYPNEPVPAGWEAQDWLEHIVLEAATARYPEGIPPRTQMLLDEEFAIVRAKRYANYFLTVHDIVRFAQTRDPPILCQGRGSAANSVICFLLGITAVDPAKHNLLFSRFISEERDEPPDIDVDFEHERREEVMQYVYARYGRHRASIVATIQHYRPRSAVRDVGKALGLSTDITGRLASSVWGSHARTMEEKHVGESGLTLDNPDVARLHRMVGELLNFPRHLGQHVGGFVLTEDRLDETVPIHHAAMAERTFIEWDKDDIDALGLMKVDVLALGMLTCIRKAFDLIEGAGGPRYTLDSVPDEASDVFDMLCAGDSVGVFQVESRAQMNMLPRLRPRSFYDLAIQVAIVRPGPIQGDMVHPYLRRRQGREAWDFPAPHPDHGPADELHAILGKTLGVPLFQEQAMKLSITAARFTGSEANKLRRAMATFRNLGTISNFEAKMVEGMVARGYERDFAQRCFEQIRGFGSYGFPESHAIAFARLVWVSSYIKCRYPAAFCAALLNAQPMGFYAPAQIVRDAREHKVEVRAVDVNASDWDNSLEGQGQAAAVRIGLRQINGFRIEWAKRMSDARAAGRFGGVEELARRAALPQAALRLLADADALASIEPARREALWAVRRLPEGDLPLFAAARARELAAEADMALPAMHAAEAVAVDYQTTRLSLKGHPMQHLRAALAPDRVVDAAAVAAARNGARLRMAGIVLVRQRPGNGNAIFVTLEDETGVVNLVIWARLFELFRREVMGSRLMIAEGEVQKSPEGVVHLMTNLVTDRTPLLATLTDHGPAEPASGAARRRAGHPRNFNLLPGSRDFR